ncbi:MAG: hypothetical protein GY830_09715 [Bacteroidetes bacterium]|nr:hypothetical protein [Bacteroidota bacterium]
MNIDHTFSSNYEIELQLYPANDSIYYYPSNEAAQYGSSITLKIKYEDKSWIGCFAAGTFSGNNDYKVYSAPNPDWFFLITNGEGYYICSKNKDKWEEVKSNPIISIYPLIDNKLILFKDYTEISAYDIDGLKWETSRLSFDDFEITSINESYVKGKYWDIRSDSEETFKVDLSTGKHISSIEAIED